ncbi:hypothetical protein L208DRAFT_732361 [Tricholoma matsutake]|nr:hypothetical protein L208DRAFT_732361 [Tricholoma matsutake 945]
MRHPLSSVFSLRPREPVKPRKIPSRLGVSIRHHARGTLMLHNPLERWSYVSEHRLKNRFILIIKHPVPLPPTHWFRSLARRHGSP